LVEIKEVLGHSSITLTMRYAHLSPAHLRSCVESLDGLTPVIMPLDQMTHKMAQSTSADANTDKASDNILIS
jgi:hypothetical protein